MSQIFSKLDNRLQKGVFGGREADDKEGEEDVKAKKKKRKGRGDKGRGGHRRRKVVILGEIKDDDAEAGAVAATTPHPDINAVNVLFEAFVERMKTDTPDPIVSIY